VAKVKAAKGPKATTVVAAVAVAVAVDAADPKAAP